MCVLLMPVPKQHLTSHQVNHTQNHMSQYTSVFNNHKNGSYTVIFSEEKKCSINFFLKFQIGQSPQKNSFRKTQAERQNKLKSEANV